MTFTLADHGTVFVTRASGSRMLAAIEGIPNALDFSKVESVSYSFADEFIGKLLQRIHDGGGRAPALLNMRDEVERLVRLSLANRDLSLR